MPYNYSLRVQWLTRCTENKTSPVKRNRAKFKQGTETQLAIELELPKLNEPRTINILQLINFKKSGFACYGITNMKPRLLNQERQCFPITNFLIKCMRRNFFTWRRHFKRGINQKIKYSVIYFSLNLKIPPYKRRNAFQSQWLIIYIYTHILIKTTKTMKSKTQTSYFGFWPAPRWCVNYQRHINFREIVRNTKWTGTKMKQKKLCGGKDTQLIGCKRNMGQSCAVFQFA